MFLFIISHSSDSYTKYKRGKRENLVAGKRKGEKEILLLILKIIYFLLGVLSVNDLEESIVGVLTPDSGRQL